VLEGLAKKPAGDEEEEQPQLKLKVKTKGGKGDAIDRLKVENWSSEEQKCLESALQQFPKGLGKERWDKIASAVPGRSKVCKFKVKVAQALKIGFNIPFLIFDSRRSACRDSSMLQT
jgi:hypothetical protein